MIIAGIVVTLIVVALAAAGWVTLKILGRGMAASVEPTETGESW